MRALSDYLALVPPEHVTDANFMVEVELVIAPFADQQAFLASLPAAFDVDTAIGAQLDAVGAWVGISRKVPVPIPNPWFSFGTAGLGWGQGFWKADYEGIGLDSLDDVTYRRLIKAKIAANNCNGTSTQIQAALNAYFGAPGALGGPAGLGTFVVGESSIGMLVVQTNVFCYDASDWSQAAMEGVQSADIAMTIGLSGTIPNVVDLSILSQMLIPVQPAAVRLNWGVTTVNEAPVFGFGVGNEFIAGWGSGAWGRDPDWVAENVIA